MRILDKGSYLTIEFGPPDAYWSLLVVDDFWDRLVDFICGLEDPLKHNRYKGYGEKCVDPESVTKFWKENQPSREIFERTLLMMPWMVNGIEGYNAVTFCGFPNDVDSLQRILSEETGSVPPHLRRWAFLIDVAQQSGSESVPRFEETWDMLDKAGQPAFSRAMFTRGGMALPEWTDKVFRILKSVPTGGAHAHRRQVRRWLRDVRGIISDQHYRAAEDYCHSPTDLKTDPVDKRQLVCEDLARHDPYGVWRWAGESATTEPLAGDAAHRWLAGKAFQTWPGGRKDIQVAGLVAICAGVNFLYEGIKHRYKPHFTLTSALYNVAEKDINFIDAMGRINLSSGNYESFARALRHWLTLPEQFEQNRSRITAVNVEQPQAGQPLRLEFTFAERVSDTIFNPRHGERQGRTTHAWQQLRKFAAGADVSGNPTVALLFDYVPYKPASV